MAYVLFLRQETWSAKQSLIVRDDLLGQSFKPGRFESLESMKSAQETILEIARKPQVIRNTLEELGPESKGLFGLGGRGWPSDEVIETVQGAITFTAPNGAEFGETEVIVLNTKASSRERSRKFIELLLKEIIIKVDEVRSLRLQSMEVELIQARDAAMLALDDSKERLRLMDQTLGPDIAAMNALNDSQSSDISLKRDISQIRSERRQVESELESLRTILAMLNAAQENPEQIVNISGDLSKFQPTLEALKKELIKTQADLAVMVGGMEPLHPRVIHAKNSIDAMQQQIFFELPSSIRGLESDIAIKQKKLQRLNLAIAELGDRLINLGSKRADALTLIADLRKRTEIANNAQSALAEIQGLSMAKHADLLTRVDEEPQVATRPDGIGKKTLVIAGAFGGFMFGMGLVLLAAPPFGGPSTDNPSWIVDQSDRLFNPRTVEKIVEQATTAASTAATTAMQSVNWARQMFMPQGVKQEEVDSQNQSPQPTAKNSDTVGTQQNTPTRTQAPAPAPVQASNTRREPSKPATVRSASQNVASPTTAALLGQAKSQAKNVIAQEDAATAAQAASRLATMQLAATNAARNNQSENQPTNPNAPLATVDQAQVDAKTVRSKPQSVGARIEPRTIIDSNSPAEPQRRTPNVRPVDLAKSVEQKTSFTRVTSTGDQSKASNAGPGATKINDSSVADSKATQTGPTKSDDAQPSNNPFTSGNLQAGEAKNAVPEQIKKLRDSISKFANPPKDGPSNGLPDETS